MDLMEVQNYIDGMLSPVLYSYIRAMRHATEPASFPDASVVEKIAEKDLIDIYVAALDVNIRLELPFNTF